MATVPRDALDVLTAEINGISADAQARVLKVLESITWTPEAIADCRDIVLQALAQAMPAYTELAAQASADFYDAERELSVGRPMGARAISGYDPGRTESAVRALVQDIVDGKPVEQFNDQVLQRMDYEMKRSAGNSMLENGRADPRGPRFARVPTGSETCEFCLMLASRGFAYRSEESAGALDHYHANCDCRIVASFDADTVEGYDPDAYLEMWRKSEEMKAKGMPVGQRMAVLEAMRESRGLGGEPDPVKASEAYGLGMRSAWASFKRLGKTPEAYESTVGAFLSEMGRASGCELSAEFKARPDGNELWAATKLASEFDEVRFRYAGYESPNPDYLLDGDMAELKTPVSRRKLTNRLNDIHRQFSPYPGERRVGILSTAYLQDDIGYVVDTSQRFVDDGTLDEVMVIMPDGTIRRIEKQ